MGTQPKVGFSVVAGGDWSGEYTWDGVETHYSKDVYRKESSTHMIFWSSDYGGYWWFGNQFSDINGQTYYFINNSNDTPPLTGWAVWSGPSPAPTLTPL